ncbi:hypothetical protein K461DRAFT_306962 [Myriangium duriaei CBS 260.36]|uniref:Uncharacterized protein n=1 Tax=Myriangium duriaei CBS 260.36 TaxID=1168546 RepID=A0A9P4J1J5_9PEZI|nr:hypothetical protein K461DRAFT_306962 [Myriangium duriaei CBS 260.36]
MKNLLITASLYGMAMASSWFNSPEPQLHQLFRRSDVNVIETAIYNISNYTATLTTLINGFTLADINTLQAETDNVIGAITAGNKAVSGIQPIEINDVLALTPIVTNLATLVNKSITATIGKFDTFGGLVPVILNGLQKQSNLTTQFSLTVSSKLPSSVVGAAAAANQPIFNALASGIAEFSKPYANKDPSVYSSGASTLAPMTVLAVVIAGIAIGMVMI